MTEETGACYCLLVTLNKSASTDIRSRGKDKSTSNISIHEEFSLNLTKITASVAVNTTVLTYAGSVPTGGCFLQFENEMKNIEITDLKRPLL